MIGLAALLLTLKAFYFGGLYGTWASGGGDIRTIKDTSVTLNPYILFRYLGDLLLEVKVPLLVLITWRILLEDTIG